MQAGQFYIELQVMQSHIFILCTLVILVAHCVMHPRAIYLGFEEWKGYDVASYSAPTYSNDASRDNIAHCARCDRDKKS